MADSVPTVSDAPAAETRPASLWPTTGAVPLNDATDAATAARRRRERVASVLDICRATLGLRVVLFVQVAAAAAALVAARGPDEWLQLTSLGAFPALVATLAWLAAVCGAKRVLAAWPAAVRGASLTVLGAAAALASHAALVPMGLVRADLWSAVSAAGAGAFVAGLVAAWMETRARTAQPADASARLAELQSRIRPHFLFNALNSALALIQADPQRAERVLEDLAELFRVALAEAGASVSLAEEVDLAQRYLAIEQVRFGDRMSVQWHTDPAADAARVPPLVLQPLVENAVRHGVEPSPTGGHIRVRTQARRGMVRVHVSNSMPSQASQPGAGIALANVRERLRLLHDMGGSLETWREGDEFHARMTLPL